jgi:SAM-dependent methyltransferase
MTLTAYERLAPAYDVLTADYCHGRWLAVLEALALEHGLRGKRLLDVACGTGKSFLPLLERGYDVVGCDLSPAMLARAAAKAPRARLVLADMRRLERLGEFDLVTCLDDSLNYVLTRAEASDSIVAMAANLAPGGLLAFDVNTLGTYRRLFGRDSVSDTGERVFCWRGEASGDAAAGERFAAAIDVFSHAHDGCWTRATSRHEQRHHPRAEIEAALALAGLELVAVRGQAVGARLEPEPDEERHQKLVFLARREGR